MLAFHESLARETKKLCHNCDTKPGLADETDFFDEMRLLILRNLLKTKIGPKNPAYEVRPLLFNPKIGPPKISQQKNAL